MHTLPWATLLRLWDLLLYEGTALLHRAALALLERLAPAAMQCTGSLSLSLTDWLLADWLLTELTHSLKE